MIFLTGASGFVGRHLLNVLRNKSYKIRALILPGEDIPIQAQNIEWVRGDIRHKGSLMDYFTEIETVLHLAGLVANHDEKSNYEINFKGTKNLVDLSRENDIKKFLYMSAAAVKFKRLNAYGKTKKLAEDYVKAAGIPYVIVRTPLIIGKGCQEFERFHDYVNKLPKIVLVFGNGRAVKRPVYIEDVTTIISKIIEKVDLRNKTFEVSCKESITVDDLINMVTALTGRRKYKIHVPLRFSIFIAQIMEKVFGSKSPISKDILLGLNEDVDFDITDAIQILKFTPQKLTEANLRKAVCR